MKRSLFLILLTCFSVHTHAQTQLSVKVTPQNILHPITAMIPIGIEFRKNNFGFEYEHGFRTTPIVFDWNPTAFNQKYFRSRLGLRYYISNRKINQFMGVYASYLPYKFQKNNGWYRQSTNIYQYLSSNINVQYFRFNLYYGLKIPISSSFNFEFLSGFGLKQKTVSHSTTGQVLAVDQELWDEWGVPVDRNTGTTFRPTFLLNFKLEYVFYNKDK